MTRVQIRRRAAAATFVAVVAIHNVIVVLQRPAAELAVQIKASVALPDSYFSKVQPRIRISFDTGRGIEEGGSVVETVVAAPATQLLFVRVPTGTIRSIRFDSLQAGGNLQITEALIQRPRTHALLHRFDPSRIVPGNQATTATEPPTSAQLTLSCDPPLTVRYTAEQIFSGQFFRINALWLLFGAVLLLSRRLFHRYRPNAPRLLVRIDRFFASRSQRFARSTVFPLDRVALWFYALCLTAFGIMAIAGLHGSSISIYSSTYGYSATKDRPFLGTPKGTRVDEWNYHTPTILNQLLRRDPLAADSSLFGPDKAALFANVPTRHWSEWFRPQFWVFHWLPPAAAYSIYWQTKGLLLLTGLFSLLLLITRSSTAAALGALWYLFSAYTQWCFSWPTLLPEMIGLFGWVICLGAYLTVGRSGWRLALAAVLCTVFAVNFAMCAYPPHQFPLVILGLAIAGWWIWTHTDLIFRKTAWRARSLALAACGFSIALVMGLFYLDVRVGFAELAHTIYPGQRSVGGGTLTPAQMLSHFLDFWKSETRFPPELGNICEGTGFLWLAPAALLVTWSSMTRRVKIAILFLCVPFLLFVAWMLLPIPAALGSILFLDKVPAHRCLPTVGLINVALVALCVSTVRRNPSGPLLPSWANLSMCLGLFILLLAALRWMSSFYHHFFTTFEILAAAGYAAFLILCLSNGWKRSLAVTLLLPAVATTALVNPVDRGFEVISKSSLSATIERRPELKDSRWLVFSSWVMLPGFFSATGLDLFNGLKIIPSLNELNRFDPDQKYASVINQSCYLVAKVQDELGTSEFERPVLGVVVWKVHPLDPRLKEIGIKYLAFDSEPSESLREKLKLIFKEESQSVWAYELP